MKAIHLTQIVKDRNPKRFQMYNVGDIFKFIVPNVFITSEGRTTGYRKRLDLQTEDGIRDLFNPVGFNPNTQRLGEIIKDGDVYRYTAVDLTDEELDDKIPNEIPRVAFKLALKKTYNLSDQQVIDAINFALNNNIITELQHYEAMVKWNQGTVIVRKDPVIMQLLPLVNQMNNLNITEEDVNEIFKTF